MPRDEQLRIVRVIHLTLVFSVLAIIAVGEFLRNQGAVGSSDVNLGLIHKVFLVMLVSALGAIAMLRSRWVTPAVESLRIRPDDETAWNRWRGGNITSFVLCESVALFGFVLRVLGGELLQAAPFYGVSVLLLFAFAPRDPAH